MLASVEARFGNSESQGVRGTGNRCSKMSNPASTGMKPNGVDLTYFLVAELAKSFGFPCKNGGAESLGDFRYSLSPRHCT